ncbi:MAG: choice-of-anchor V domain-containing protein [Candidatus Hodarchaeales archaeon]
MTSSTNHESSYNSSKKRPFKLILSLFTITLVIFILLGTTAGDATSGGTTSSCGICHGPEGTTVTITMTGLPTSYEPDKEYNITVSITDDVLPVGSQGVWISTDKGTLETIDSNLKESSSDLVHNVTTAAEWSFNWTAPSDGSGQVDLKVVALVGDGASTQSGDSWRTSDFIMDQHVPQDGTETTSGTGTTATTTPPPPPNFTGDVIFAGVFGTGITFVVFTLIVGADIRDRRKKE